MKSLIRKNVSAATKSPQFQNWCSELYDRRDFLRHAGKMGFVLALGDAANNLTARNSQPVEFGSMTIQGADQLCRSLSRLDYTFPATEQIRDAVRKCDLTQRSRLLSLMVSMIADLWINDPARVGILCSVLSTNFDVWDPTSPVLCKLEELCNRALTADIVSLVGSIEPLTFALAGKGRPEANRRCLRLRVQDKNWRKAHADRSQLYYGDFNQHLSAIIRHHHDPSRLGLARAHDISTIVHYLQATNDHQLPQLLTLLERQMSVLSAHGERNLLPAIRSQLAKFDIPSIG